MVQQELEFTGPLDVLDISLLARRFTRGEVEVAWKEFHPNKAPGKDGMHALFLQKFWHIICDDVSRVVLRALNDGIWEEGLCDTIVKLLPKMKNPTRVKDFSPISLCNVRCKLVSKVLANRIQKLMGKIIDGSQSAFIKWRLITNNFIIASEIFHFM